MGAMIVRAILLGVIVVCGVIGVKNARTFTMHRKLGDAIYRYHIACVMDGDFEAVHKVDYHDMESYEATLFRLWDWGYSRILPKDKLEIIKPFIE